MMMMTMSSHHEGINLSDSATNRTSTTINRKSDILNLL